MKCKKYVGACRNAKLNIRSGSALAHTRTYRVIIRRVSGLLPQVWLCGGRVVNVPCSHAGHLEEHGHRDYRHGWQAMINRNYKRVAEVWLDDYRKYFYYYHSDIQVSDNRGKPLMVRHLILLNMVQRVGEDIIISKCRIEYTSGINVYI